MTETLTHNPRNAVTHAIERVPHGGTTAVRKTLNGLNAHDTLPEWAASGSPKHWNYWRREALVYQSQLSAALASSGVRLPELLSLVEQDHKIELLIEDVDGRSGSSLTLDDYAIICYGWGKAQALLANTQWQQPWISRSFLRQYTTSKPVNYQILYAKDAWSRPLIANNWPPELKDKLIWLYEQSEKLYSIVKASTRAPCHLDFWPNNVILDSSDTVVPIDWAFYGEGAIGEDIANFIPDAVFDGFAPPELLPELEERLFAAYLNGLKAGGYSANADSVRNTFYACAVKYVWLGPLLLQKAGESVQTAYGDGKLVDANLQYRNRGLALEYICDWAQRAIIAQQS